MCDFVWAFKSILFNNYFKEISDGIKSNLKFIHHWNAADLFSAANHNFY